MKIFVVEDEPKVHQLLQRHFEAQGHVVQVADSGEGALKGLASFQPDVTLLDLWLKGYVTGMEVLKNALKLAPKTRIVIVTGFDESIAPDAFQMGAVAFLKKPVHLEELDDAIGRLQQPSEERSS